MTFAAGTENNPEVIPDIFTLTLKFFIEQKIPVLITVTGDTAVWAHGTYYVTINSTASEQ